MEYNPNLTATYLAGVVDKLVKDQGRDTIRRNAANDPNARYARIPDGNACDFCRMLGSRGFVYHSEAKAGGDDQYHKKCNCQIAVSFDPFMEDYWVGNVHVRRGYADDAQLVVPGRDGSYELRTVDIDELFKEYKAAGKRYTKRSVYKDYSLLPDFMKDPLEYLRSAETEEELRKRADEVLAAYKKYFTKEQLEKRLPSARYVAQKRLSELQKQSTEIETVHLLRMTGKETYSYYSSDEERIRDWMRAVTMVPQKEYSGPNIANKTRADMQTRDDISIVEPLLEQAESRGLITYGKTIDKFTADPSEGRDLFVHTAIIRDGRQIEVLREIQQSGRKNIDTIIDGKRVEIKCPISDGKSKHPLRFVKDNFYTAVEQFKKDIDANEREVRLLYCTRYTPIDDGLIIAELEKFKSKEYVAAIEVLKKDGTFHRVK